MCTDHATEKLDAHLRVFRKLYDCAREAVAILSLSGVFLEQNQEHRALLAYSDEDLSGVTPQLYLGEAFSEYLAAARRGSTKRGEAEAWTQKGERLSLDISVLPVDDEEGVPAALIFIARDITARKKLESRYRFALQGGRPAEGTGYFTSLVRQLADTLEVECAFVFDVDAQFEGRLLAFHADNEALKPTLSSGLIREVAQSSEIVVRCGPELGREEIKCCGEGGCGLFLTIRDLRGVVQGLIGVMHGKQLFHRAQAASILQLYAERAWTELERASTDAQLRALALELDEANEELRRLANVDPLTGLLNQNGLRRVLVDELRDARLSKQPLSALVVDCDDLHLVNNAYGTVMGDIVLKEVGRRLLDRAQVNQVVARVGGDEFVVLLPNTKLDVAAVLAERFRLSVSASPILLTDDPLRLTVSIGVVEVPDYFSTVEEILTLGHPCLTESKQQGKNSISSGSYPTIKLNRDSGLQDSVSEMLLGVNGIRALSQPIVHLDDESEVAHEMLCRGPQGPFESPKDFFRYSIEQNILTAVDLRCLQVSLVHSTALQSKIHVNLFPSTILATPPSLLVDFFAAAPSRYVVEINEQQSLYNPEELKSHVQALKAAGVTVALDDVGFGRSSLEALLILEPDVVKIDRSCVHGVSRDSQKARLLARLVKAVHALEADLVAEGIEERVDVRLLREMGIMYGQGFLWGRPGKVLSAAG